MTTATLTRRLGHHALSGLLLCLFGSLSSPARADIYYTQPLIDTAPICIGFACYDGYPFSYESMVLSADFVRMLFTDHSSATGYPTNDWSLDANDQYYGGANAFSIVDVTTSNKIFRTYAGAPENSLVVAASGMVGLGTSAPQANLHMVGGNTPVIKFDQDGSAGWTPQAWEIGGNEQEFFVRDVNNNDALPLQIGAGAPSNALTILPSGAIGIGITSTAKLKDGRKASLRVHRETGDASVLVDETSTTVAARDMLELRNNGVPQLSLNNTSTSNVWRIASDQSLTITRNNTDPAAALLQLDKRGNLTISGTLYTVASCAAGCDRVFRSDAKIDSIDEHARKMWSAAHLPALGPTDENGQFDLSAMTGGMLNELEQAHIYIAELNQRLEDSEARAVASETELAALKLRLARIESLLEQRDH